jgi:hypothetical protein
MISSLYWDWVSDCDDGDGSEDCDGDEKDDEEEEASIADCIFGHSCAIIPGEFVLIQSTMLCSSFMLSDKGSIVFKNSPPAI